jgi:hypothetical protein
VAAARIDITVEQRGPKGIELMNHWSDMGKQILTARKHP